MATKATIVNGEVRQPPVKRQETNSVTRLFDNVVGLWNEFGRFLGDVRAEMRKVVTPSRKEVEATTTVVIVAVFIFGVFFFVVDWIFDLGLHGLLTKLGGLQQ
jgi:preprotein translocase subunit SecE